MKQYSSVCWSTTRRFILQHESLYQIVEGFGTYISIGLKSLSSCVESVHSTRGAQHKR